MSAARAHRVRVVVDGSNFATEGRTTPSLTQLDEAVRAFLEENPHAEVIVVADAKKVVERSGYLLSVPEGVVRPGWQGTARGLAKVWGHPPPRRGRGQGNRRECCRSPVPRSGTGPGCPPTRR